MGFSGQYQDITTVGILSKYPQNSHFLSSRDTIAPCHKDDSLVPRTENLIVFPPHSFSLLNISEF